MEDAKKVFERLERNKKEYKKKRDYFKEQYENNPRYVELQEKVVQLNKQKTEIKNMVHESDVTEYNKMLDLKIDIASDKEMLGDIVLSTIMKGQEVALKNEYEQDVLPIFKVTFKKAN